MGKMNLKKYKEKRDFRQSPEPPESRSKIKKDGAVYVIQKHKASHLHYDLRLEEGEVLKSWAIPKEPPVKEGVRRLAVKTEDHPLGYEDFEGIIPEGQYGAGKVETWDKGAYQTIEDKFGKKVFEIKGKKLHGRFCLIKLKANNSDDKNWLFFKLKENK